MEQSLELLRKRWIELSKVANLREIVTFSNFLTIGELNTFNQIKGELESDFHLFGGYEFAERQMVAFLPDALYYEWEYPIHCLRFRPAYPKFAQSLNHRDMLGALMSLGVDRSRIGDIKQEEHTFYVFCEETISTYLLESLHEVRHTILHGSLISDEEITIQQEYMDMEGIVSSVRLDNVVSFVTGYSRSKSVILIQSQKISVNGRVVSSNAYQCREKDILSIRGFGKYIYWGNFGETKKGKIKIQIKKYI